MDAVMVEVVTRWGQVRSRHRLTSFPATLGRGHACDVVLDEADVSALHARLELGDDGHLRLVDTGSTNGLRFQGRKVASVDIAGRVDVRLGSTHLRLVPSTAPAEKTAIFRVSRLDSPRAALAAWGLLVAHQLVVEVGLATQRVEPGPLANKLVGVALVAPLVWAFLWALASRVGQGHLRFTGHFAATCLAFAALGWLEDGVVDVVGFHAHVGAFGGNVLEACLGVPLVSWLLFQHLTRVTRWPPRRALGIATAVVLGLLGIMALPDERKAGQLTLDLPDSVHALPPALAPAGRGPASMVGEDVAVLVRELGDNPAH